MQAFVRGLCVALAFGAFMIPAFSYQESHAILDPTPTQTHFTAVKRISHRALTRRDAITFGQYALWLDQAADRLDALPTAEVEAEFVEFAIDVAQRLRNVAHAYREIGLVASVTRNQGHYNCSTQWYSYPVRYYYWAYYARYWCRFHRDLTPRRVAAADASRFRDEQAIEIKRKAAELSALQ